MHGNPDSRYAWEPLFAELGDGFRCIAPDFPGFGDSEPFPPGVALGPALMAGFWDGFIDAAGLHTAVNVVVHDFGGPWLLPWVATHPERVRSVFVLNTLFHRDYPWHLWAKIWQTPILGELAMRLTSRPVLSREMRLHAPGVSRKLVDETYHRMHRTMRRTVLQSYRAYARPGQIFEGWEEKLLAAFNDLPVRVVWGDRDPYISARFAERFGVEPIHLPDYGHWAFLQAPGVVAGYLKEFLSASTVS
jgi:pimeloyl-ACP methyl ester carboxylesterase